VSIRYLNSGVYGVILDSNNEEGGDEKEEK
jgi:hypothetical protein